jgi:hypothetical protein
VHRNLTLAASALALTVALATGLALAPTPAPASAQQASVASSAGSVTAAAPGVPIGLYATKVARKVTLHWKAVPALGAGGSYRIWRSYGAAGPWALVGTSAATSYADPSVLSGSGFYYTVSAVATSGAYSARCTPILVTLPALSTRVIDYAAGYRAALPAILKAAKIGIVVRYVGSSAWKCLTRAEATGLRNAGIGICFVYESKAGFMLGGRPAGVAAAKAAAAGIKACGGPSAPFVYFACDVDTANTAAVNACLAGAASVLGPGKVGIYGGYAVCDSALKTRSAARAWQTVAWSQHRLLNAAVLYQGTSKPFGTLGGLSYDANLMYAPDIGQWK